MRLSQSNINATKLAEMPLPLPTLPEQDEVLRIGARLLFAVGVERRVRDSSEDVEKLTQSILSKAFSGELVPTEAELARAEGRTYETAEELLARIQIAPDKRSAKKPSREPRPRRAAHGATTAGGVDEE
jgi:type I restriction enzyme S subunit